MKKGRPEPPFFFRPPHSVGPLQLHPRAESTVLAVAAQLLAVRAELKVHDQRSTIGTGCAETERFAVERRPRQCNRLRTEFIQIRERDFPRPVLGNIHRHDSAAHADIPWSLPRTM